MYVGKSQGNNFINYRTFHIQCNLAFFPHNRHFLPHNIAENYRIIFHFFRTLSDGLTSVFITRKKQSWRKFNIIYIVEHSRTKRKKSLLSECLFLLSKMKFSLPLASLHQQMLISVHIYISIQLQKCDVLVCALLKGCFLNYSHNVRCTINSKISVLQSCNWVHTIDWKLQYNLQIVLSYTCKLFPTVSFIQYYIVLSPLMKKNFLSYLRSRYMYEGMFQTFACRLSPKMCFAEYILIKIIDLPRAITLTVIIFHNLSLFLALVHVRGLIFGGYTVFIGSLYYSCTCTCLQCEFSSRAQYMYM